MAVGDFLGQYRVAGNFAPVDLTCESVGSSMKTSVLQDMRERVTYIFQVLLLQDCKQESSHGIVVVRHDVD